MMDMMKRIVECVPNFSEGRDEDIIREIVGAIEREGMVKVLHVDRGEGANRTVVTFVGEAEDVADAAFRAVECAGRLIDMRSHHGAHPRIGATDVLPLVPVSGISLEECADLARSLAGRIFNELGIPCYCYEAAAFTPEKRDLAFCRRREYEALPEKMLDPMRRPDFCPDSVTETVLRSGATVVGAREFLIAVNFNLDTADAALAHEIACDVRTRGRGAQRPGTLAGCKALGWYIEEYGIAQVSMNITDIKATPLHIAYEEVCRAAAARGARVTGTEIIGLVPERVLVEAGKFYLKGRDATIDEMITAAIEAMHLDDLRPFNPKEKIIEKAS